MDAQTNKKLTKLLYKYTALHDEVIDEINNLQNDNELTNLILEIDRQGHKLSPNQYHKLYRRITDEENDITYLFNARHPDKKKVIEIVFSNVKLTGYELCNILYKSSENKNYEWLNILLDKNHLLFTNKTIKYIFDKKSWSAKSAHIKRYTNPMNNINNSIIIYVMWKLISKKKIDEVLFNSAMNFIENTGPLDLYYFEYTMWCMKYLSDINGRYGKMIIKAIFMNVIKNPLNCDALYNSICKKWARRGYLCSLVIDNIYKDGFVNVMMDMGIFKKNVGFLFRCIEKYGFVVDIEFMNKLMEKMEKGEDNIKNSSKINIKFDMDGDEIIKINDGNKKIYVLDMMVMFGRVPNDDTFKIALGRGYTYTVNKLINDYGFVVNDMMLYDAIKSKNIVLINKVLEVGKFNVISNKVFDYLIKENNVKKIYENAIHNKLSHKTKTIAIVELLVKYGLKVNLKDVSMLLSDGSILLGLERFGIPYDEELYFECYVNESYPKEYMKKFKIDKNILKMRHYKYMGSDNASVKFLKDCGNIIDMYTLERIVRCRQGWRGSRFGQYMLNTYKCVPHVGTLYKTSLCLGNFNRNYGRRSRRSNGKRQKSYSTYNCGLYKEFIKNNNINKDTMIKDSGIKI